MTLAQLVGHELRRTTLLPNGCMISSSCNDRLGYARARFGGKSHNLYALVLTFYAGERPKGLECCHSCGNASCINPEHLRWDTHKANMEDYARHRLESL